MLGLAGDSLVILKSEVKSQEKHIKTLKKRSLWSKILEEVMEQLVDVVYYLYQEIHDNFGPGAFSKEAENFYKPKTASLGTSGLSLHYANIINQIDNLVSRPTSVPPNTRDMLYQGLSPSMKASLRTHLQQSSELDLVANLLSCASLAFFIAPEVFYENHMQLDCILLFSSSRCNCDCFSN
jgi:hypothetical protein